MSLDFVFSLGGVGFLIGLRLTIGLIGIAGVALSVVAYLYSPLKTMRELPEQIPCPVGWVPPSPWLTWSSDADAIAGNSHAFRFWHKMGFVENGERYKQDQFAADTIILEKPSP